MFDWPRTTGRSVWRPKACEKLKPGVNAASWLMSWMPLVAMVSRVNADTATGVSCNDSLVRRAVTMTSSRPSAAKAGNGLSATAMAPASKLRFRFEIFMPLYPPKSDAVRRLGALAWPVVRVLAAV